MKVFLSWSGPTSKQVALALRDWLKKVIQSVEPWMSDKDIESGARWSDEIAGNLKDAKIGIICLTPENKQAPWIHFEAGAISKTVDDAYVCPFLYRLEPTDVVGPLAQFQASRANREGTFRLVQTINGHPSRSTRLSDSDLKEGFDLWWNKLEARIGGIKATQQPAAPRRSPDDMIAEILQLVRNLAKSTVDPNYFIQSFKPDVGTVIRMDSGPHQVLLRPNDSASLGPGGVSYQAAYGQAPIPEGP